MSSGKRTPEHKSSSSRRGSPLGSDTYDDGKEEMMVIDINFGKDRSDEIVVHFDDDPHDLAEEFVKKHGLKASSVSLIARHIEYTIQEFKEANTEIRPQTPPAEDNIDVENPRRSRSPRESEPSSPADLPDDSRGGRNMSSPSSQVSETNGSLRQSPNHRNISNQSPRSRSHTPERQDLKDSPIYSESSSRRPFSAGSANRSNSQQHPFTNDNNNKTSSRPVSGTFSENGRQNSRRHDTLADPIDGQSIVSDLEEDSPMDDYGSRRHGRNRRDRSSMIVERDTDRDREMQWDDGHRRPHILQPSGSVHKVASVKAGTKPPSASKQLSQRDLKPSNSSFDLHSSAEVEIPEIDEPDLGPLSAEDIYNKLKRGFGPTKNKKSAAVDQNLSVLQPKSSTLRLDPATNGGIRNSNREERGGNISGNLSVGSNMTPVPPVPKTASERLYLSAQTMKARADYRKRQADIQEEQLRKEKQFKLSTGSKVMLSGKTHVLEQDVGQRLYEEAKLDSRRKQQDLEKQRRIPPSEEWSCSKCGTFQKSPAVDLKTILIEASKSPNYSNESQAAGIKPKPLERRCMSCGWVQGNMAAFKPENIAEAAGGSQEFDRNKTQRRYTDEGETLFDYLHSNSRQQSQRLNQMKSVWKEMDSVMTFKPVIPTRSGQLLKQVVAKAEKMKEKRQTGDVIEEKEDIVIRNKVSDSSNSNSDVGTAEAVELGEYLSMSVVKRLSKVKTVKVIAVPSDQPNTVVVKPVEHNVVAGTFASNAGKVVPKVPKTAPKPIAAEAPIIRPKKEIDRFVDRLTSERETLAAKRESAYKSFYSTDQKSGQPLFQPKIPVPPRNVHIANSADRSSTAEGSLSKRGANVAVTILAKDEALKQHRKQMELEAAERLKADMAKNRATALPQSEKILQQATQRSIEDMFKLLLASTQDWVLQGRLAWSESERAETVSRVSNELIAWEEMKLDLRLVEPSMMIEEVQSLLDMILKRQTQLVRDSNNDSMLSTVGSPTQVDQRSSQDGHDQQSSMTLQELLVAPLDRSLSPPPPPQSMQNMLVAGLGSNVATNDAAYSTLDTTTSAGIGNDTQAIVPRNSAKKMSRAQASKRALTIRSQAGTDIHADGSFRAPNMMTLGVDDVVAGDSEDDDLLLLAMPPPPPLLPQPPPVSGESTEVADFTSSVQHSSAQTLMNSADSGIPRAFAPAGTSASSKDNDTACDSGMIVTFPAFRDLVLYCLRKRKGPGRNYVYAPKKKPEVTMSMIKKVLAEETFTPQIDPISDSLSRHRQGRGLINSRLSASGASMTSTIATEEGGAQPTTIVDVLYREGERMNQKAMAIKIALRKEEVKECTFKPTLFRPPKSVVPRYRGVPDLSASQTILPNSNEQSATDDIAGEPHVDEISQVSASGPALLERQSTILTASSCSATSSIGSPQPSPITKTDSDVAEHAKLSASSTMNRSVRSSRAGSTATSIASLNDSVLSVASKSAKSSSYRRSSGDSASKPGPAWSGKKPTPLFVSNGNSQSQPLPPLPVERKLSCAVSPTVGNVPRANITEILGGLSPDSSHSNQPQATTVIIPTEAADVNVLSSVAVSEFVGDNKPGSHTTDRENNLDNDSLKPVYLGIQLENCEREPESQLHRDASNLSSARSFNSDLDVSSSRSSLSDLPPLSGYLVANFIDNPLEYSSRRSSPSVTPPSWSPGRSVVSDISRTLLDTAANSANNAPLNRNQDTSRLSEVVGDTNGLFVGANAEADRTSPSGSSSMISATLLNPAVRSIRISDFRTGSDEINPHQNEPLQSASQLSPSLSEVAEKYLLEPLDDNRCEENDHLHSTVDIADDTYYSDDRRISGISDRSDGLSYFGTPSADDGGDPIGETMHSGYESDRTTSTHSSLTQIKDGSPRILLMRGERSSSAATLSLGLGSYAAAIAAESASHDSALSVPNIQESNNLHSEPVFSSQVEDVDDMNAAYEDDDTNVAAL